VREFTVDRKLYNDRRAYAATNLDTVISLTMDGADQSSYSVPHFTSPSKSTSQAHKLIFTLQCVNVHGRGYYSYYLRHKAVAKDASYVITCLHQTLVSVFQDFYIPNNKRPSILYIQADNCCRENKNIYVLGYLAYLIKLDIFDKIVLSFGVVGHTHNEVDAYFGHLAGYMTRHEVYNVEGYEEALRKCNKNVIKVTHLTELVNWRSFFNRYCIPFEGIIIIYF
jgi:hypothetical protein